MKYFTTPSPWILTVIDVAKQRPLSFWRRADVTMRIQAVVFYFEVASSLFWFELG